MHPDSSQTGPSGGGPPLCSADYLEIKAYEHHFNNLQTEIRKMTSGWLLAALGAVAYLATSRVENPLFDRLLLIPLVCLMGNIGILILWILDQLVYHRLLNAVFLLGLRMEYLHCGALPPIRTLMMLFSQKLGMARYLRHFYLVPVSVLAGIALISSLYYLLAAANQCQDPRMVMGALALPALALAIPFWVRWKAANLEKFEDIARGFGDQDFVDYLAKGEYQKVLKGS